MLRPIAFISTYLLLITATPRLAAQPAEAQRHFETGNKCYAEAQYDEALAAYQRVLNAGRASGALYYNMGNTYFRMGELGQAIRYYEKARQLIPENPELAHNLDIARQKADGTGSTSTRSSGGVTLLAALDVEMTFILGLLLYLLGLGAGFYRIWISDSRAWLRAGAWSAAIAGLLIVALALGASLARTMDRRAVVITDQAILYAAPDPGAPRDTTVGEGLMLKLQRRRPAWSEVRLPNGTTGWLRSEVIGDV